MYFTQFIIKFLTAFALILLPFSPIYARENPSDITASATEKAQKITESQIRKILDEMKGATQNRNAAGVTKFMSANIAIELTVKAASGSQTIRLNRSEYSSYLQQGFAMRENYTGSYSNIKVKIQPDGKSAIATFNFTEQVGFQGQTIQSTSSETVKFELIQGQILATSIKAVTSIE